jgi:hypothetical protein
MPRSYLLPVSRRPQFISENGVRSTNRFGAFVDSTFVTNISAGGRIDAKSAMRGSVTITVAGAVYGTITAQSRCVAAPSISVALAGRIEAKSRAQTFVPVPVSLAGRSFSKSNMRIVPPGIKPLAGIINAQSSARSDFTHPPAARTKEFGVTVING